MKNLFTRKGDNGTTGLLGEGRVKKNDRRMEALGTIDELSANLGAARSLLQNLHQQDIIKRIQVHLYEMMAEIAATKENQPRYRKITKESINELESQIDDLSTVLPEIKDFILPGDSNISAAYSISRTVCRRAERRVVEIFDERMIENEQIPAYLNRLSSLLFVLEIKTAMETKQNPTTAKEIS
jgi:cob(I)alamin adenosyltransferase